MGLTIVTPSGVMSALRVRLIFLDVLSRDESPGNRENESTRMPLGKVAEVGLLGEEIASEGCGIAVRGFDSSCRRSPDPEGRSILEARRINRQ
jgi:hypothetical protein